MAAGDKNMEAAPGGENEEIDRIMKEIEDLEKKMDTDGGEADIPAPPAAMAEAEAHASSNGPAAVSIEEPPTASAETTAEANSMSDKVVPIRGATESMVETDAVPVSDEPLMKSAGATGSSGLALKVGGCSEISLEFSSGEITVTLSCTDEGLKITTDQGAEFRVPFKRAA